ncbi:hypothetical protein [Streptomyces sp. Ru72]|uniref:hypothetical protein n=1 Tax=Streptomyces sp. Ru72 TaxID=2080747 RepID=UPI000CDDC427|nr:hypothetical protein [Streptomyces sp. Ru72]POX53650.1 hypothetical protein C3488_04755 [Streptomyces sp. Ru72]
MGTKTVDEARAASGVEATNDEEKAEVTRAAEAREAEATEAAEVTEADGEVAPQGPSGIGQGAGAVVSAALGFVSLSGSWLGTVAGARQQLIGQLRTSSQASVAKQIKAVYGDAWHATALWGGLFALAALIVGVVVLARPGFGAPGKPQAAWIKSVAWGGIALGVVGLFLAVLKYTDILLGLPSAS